MVDKLEIFEDAAPFEIQAVALPSEQELSDPQVMNQARVDVDLGALLYNLHLVQKEMPGVHIMGVVKTNAYGHGLVEVAKAIEGKVTYIGTGTEIEAVQLRKSGITAPILILSPYFDINTVIEYRITPTIDRLEQLKALSEAIQRKRSALIAEPNQVHSVKFHLKINSGMNRFGISLDQLEPFMEEYQRLAGVELEGVFSHFATTKSDKPKMVKTQVQRFTKALELIKKFQAEPSLIHMANSKIAVDYPELRFNMVRIGNLLYGQVLSKRNIGVKNTYKVMAPIIDIRTIKKGEYVGYGAAFRAKRDTVVGVVPFGLYEGFEFAREPKSYSFKDLFKNIARFIFRFLKPLPRVLLHKTPLKTVGKPSMQFILVDLTDHPAVTIGTDVEIKTSIFAVKESIPRTYIHHA